MQMDRKNRRRTLALGATSLAMTLVPLALIASSAPRRGRQLAA